MFYALITGCSPPGTGVVLKFAKKHDRNQVCAQNNIRHLHGHHPYVERLRDTGERVVLLNRETA